MTPVFTTRRRVEDFNDLVEQGSTGASDDRFEAQLALVSQLRDLPRPEPSPRFTAELREQLMAAADTLLVPSEDTQRLTLPARRTARERGVAVAVGGLAVVGATTSLALASQSALPGDMLYPLKRALESAQTQLPASDESRGQTMLTYAADRLTEARALSEGGDLADTGNVAQALIDFADQATDASDLLLADFEQSGDETSVEELREFTATSMQALAELEQVLPEPARDELQYAVQVLDEIDRAAARACPGCAGGINQIPSVLLSAGRVTEPSVVVVPETVLPGTSLQPGGKQQDDEGSAAGDGGKSQQGTGPLPDVSVDEPAQPGSGGDTSDGGTDNPIETLTDQLTGKGGKGGKQKTGGGGTGGGLPGVPEVEDTVDGVVEDLDDILDDLP